MAISNQQSADDLDRWQFNRGGDRGLPCGYDPAVHSLIERAHPGPLPVVEVDRG